MGCYMGQAFVKTPVATREERVSYQVVGGRFKACMLILIAQIMAPMQINENNTPPVTKHIGTMMSVVRSPGSP